MAMSRKLWSINGLAVELDRDRRVVADAVGHLKPDGESAGRPAWFMTTAVRALTVGSDGDGLLDPAQERARKDRALAEQTEMKNNEMRGRLMHADKVTGQIAREYGVIRQRFMGIRGKLSDTLDPLQAMRVEDEIVDALGELSTPEKFDALQEAYDKQAKQETKR